MTRTELQKKAMKAWIDNGKNGTVCLYTGSGKTWVFLRILKNDPSIKRVLFLAEVTNREEDLRQNVLDFSEHEEYDVNKNHKIDFACYQSFEKYTKEYYDLIVCDEIHEAMTPNRSKLFLKMNTGSFLGLTATPDVNANVKHTDDKGEVIKIEKKRDLYFRNCPIVYVYNISQAVKNKDYRPIKIHAVSVPLQGHDNEFYNDKKELYTISKKLDYFDKNAIRGRSKAMFFLRLQMSRLFGKSKSKIKEMKKAIEIINKNKIRSIVFANSLDTISEFNIDCPSYKYSKEECSVMKSNFKEGKTHIIGSFKKLEQGANLGEVSTILIHSFYSKSRQFLQRLGRMRKSPEIGKILVFYCVGTREQAWFLDILEEVDLNIEINFHDSLNLNYEKLLLE